MATVQARCTDVISVGDGSKLTYCFVGLDKDPHVVVSWTTANVLFRKVWFKGDAYPLEVGEVAAKVDPGAGVVAAQGK